MTNLFFKYSIVITVLTVSACSQNSNKNKPEKNQSETDKNVTYHLSNNQFQSSQMKLGGLEKQPFHQIVKATGVIDVPPENHAKVSCYFGGTVRELKLLPGKQVKKGEILFTLENPDYIKIQQDYLEAKGKLAYLKSDYERQKKLMKDKVTSQKKFLKAETDYTTNKIRLKSLAKKLTLMNINPNTLTLENLRTTITILSPIDGYVTNVSISKGTFLNPSQTAVSIINTDHLHLELNIFEKDLSKIKIGQPIIFKTQNNDNDSYQATVYLINKTISLKERTINIHGHLSNEAESNKLNPGMYVEADIYTSSKSEWSLPSDALVEIDNRHYTLVLQNKSNNGYTFIKKEIATGLSNNDQTEILNSQEFDKKTIFLTEGSFNLISE